MGKTNKARLPGAAPPLAAEVTSLIKKVTLALPSHIRGLKNPNQIVCIQISVIWAALTIARCAISSRMGK
jgi:hypothetical protein